MYGDWQLQEQCLYRSILSTCFIQLWDGRSRTTGIIQSHHGAFQTPTSHVEPGRVDGQKLPARHWDSHLMAHLSQPRSSNRSVWLGYPARWFPLHTHSFLLPTPPVPPATEVPQNCIWQSRACLHLFGCPPEPGIRLLSQASHFGLLLLAQPHLFTLTESN